MNRFEVSLALRQLGCLFSTSSSIYLSDTVLYHLQLYFYRFQNIVAPLDMDLTLLSADPAGAYKRGGERKDCARLVHQRQIWPRPHRVGPIGASVLRRFPGVPNRHALGNRLKRREAHRIHPHRVTRRKRGNHVNRFNTPALVVLYFQRHGGFLWGCGAEWWGPSNERARATLTSARAGVRAR